MSARTVSAARRTRTRLLAAAALSLATLSLTACGGTDTDGAGPSSAAVAPGGQSSDAPSSQGGGSTGQDAAKGGTGSAGSGGGAGTAGSSGSGSSGSGGTGGSGGAGGSKGTGGAADGTGGAGKGSQTGASSGRLAKCGVVNLRITATSVPRPINHLLLTATNTGSKVCMLPAYPAARFGEAQSVPPVAEATKPQAVTTLAPGESGYAGVLLSGDGDNGHTVTRLTIPFDDGSIATVPLPAKSVYVDDNLTVTYWESTMGPAADF
ncbi:DUF4232 domain-containing protein [Streptomyces sp. NPDC015220]|uniref:DUF4232 domain-containing protein n=1 Tax=Streptomyces sp. NPDC015220 TaxID=3364947 RepID=UPI0036FB1D09